ncbi:Crp/Fnr family transcriptional regulator [Sutterella sp.]|uniref:Crp/Fnr family transcriptional regulator n=1 Tax=Sutterella sp. TaxID=1981025 RepID=UPI0026DEF1D8|nr:Crp/Fnr family transcriptional regulator [Sutterella sp.]MDO5531105.1 Crp/Fnr family transcriptional regulator [Sutterella sp.]
MRQVFRMRPWVFPPEPAPIAEIFKRHGKRRDYPKGSGMPHGGLGDTAQVGYLVSGLATFSCMDVMKQLHIFALLAPGRCLADLDALNPHRVNVMVEFIRPSTVLLVPRKTFIAGLRQSIDTMQLYADLAILKEESVIEGMLANFTLDMDSRLRVFLISAISSFSELRNDGWNECPLGLTITELSRIISANRSWVSTKVGEWVKAGLARKEGRRLLVHGKLFENIWDWGRGTGVQPSGLMAEPRMDRLYSPQILPPELCPRED